MKRIFAFCLICILLTSSLLIVPASAASDFEIRNGVLVKYNGSADTVTIPGDVRSIGAEALMNNTSVKQVVIPSSVVAVDDRAFYGCTALSVVSGGDNVVSVGNMAFRGTPYLDDSTAKYFMLGHVLLWYNGTAAGVTIPSHCTAVASYAFMRCEYLQSFTAYEGLLSVGTGAFYGCKKLSSVNLPSTVSEIGAYAFEGTPYLDSFSDFAVAGDGVLFGYNGSAANVEIPDTVKRIAPHAFFTSKITSVKIPDTVYAVDSLAFADCTGLSEVSFSEGLVSIGDGAFRGCKGLVKFTTPDTLSYIGQKAFAGDAALKGVSVRGDNLTLSYNAFKNCDALEYVLLSEGVGAVLDNAFDRCGALFGISIPAKTTEISSDALSGCEKVTVSCPSGSKAATALSSHTISTEKGDVDGDELNIMDASAIQHYIALLTAFDGAQVAAADVNYDADIDIMDAFYIQMRLAGYESDF